MSDEPKIFAASFLAWRDEDGQSVVRIVPGVVIAFSLEEAQHDGMDGAYAALPDSDGWKEHQVIVGELPKRMVLGLYRVSWQTEPIA
jgi:hypothetical protein